MTVKSRPTVALRAIVEPCSQRTLFPAAGDTPGDYTIFAEAKRLRCSYIFRFWGFYLYFNKTYGLLHGDQYVFAARK